MTIFDACTIVITSVSAHLLRVTRLSVVPSSYLKCTSVGSISCDSLDAALKSEDISLKQHLGGNVYLSVSKKFPFVDLRKFFYPKDQITPYMQRAKALRSVQKSGRN